MTPGHNRADLVEALVRDADGCSYIRGPRNGRPSGCANDPIFYGLTPDGDQVRVCDAHVGAVADPRPLDSDQV